MRAGFSGNEGKASPCRFHARPAQAVQRIKRTTIVIVICASSAVAGVVVQGWPGIFLWPIALCALALFLGIAVSVIDLLVTVIRHQNEVSRIRARVRRLSNDQLRGLCATPSSKESGFARVELMQRGQDARPPKEQLFSMLSSGDSVLCGQAMGFVQMFYPELGALTPIGSSNMDPREAWQARVAAMRDNDALRRAGP
jgi:hypothetical protein